MDNSFNGLIEELEDVIEKAKAIPLSQRVSIDKNEVYDIISQIRLNIPAEIQQGQRIVAKANKFINDANIKASQIIRDAEAKAEKMTMDKEIVKRAQEQADAILADANENARNILDRANEESKNMRMDSMKYADEILNNTLQCIQVVLNNYQKNSSKFDEYLSSEMDAILAERQELSRLSSENK